MSRVPSRGARHAGCGIASSPAVAGFRPAGAAVAVAAAFLLQPLAVQAQPSGAQVILGQASFATSGNTLVVTTRNGAGANHSAIDWQSFSIPAGSVTRFDQPSAGSLSINRVVGPDPSAIYGTLSSNGRLVLVNPAGIAVGQGGVVDTAGFTASTLRMSDADAIAGRLAFGGSGAAGPLQVDGTIVARSGDVVLIAPSIQTGSQAIVQAEGATILAAGQRVDITGRGLEGIHLEVQAGDQAVNLGTLKGDAVGIFADTLTHSGVIQAQAVSSEGGKVVLKAFGGDNLVSGSVAAAAADGQGGSIDVLGRRVGLLAGASLDASGPAGGGAIRVGGDYQGKNPSVPNAQATYVDANASLRADATGQGDGGRVIVWSDDATRMNGKISARGGPQGGDGGFAEVSGKQYLAFNGSADLRAPAGKVGTLLLDPNDIVIDTGTQTDMSPGPVFSGGPDPSHISEATLAAQLNGSSVIVATNGSTGSGGTGLITVDTGVTLDTWTANTVLGLQADGGINLLGGIMPTGSGAAVSMQLLGGSLTQDAASVVRVPYLLVNAPSGSVSMNGANLVGTLAIQTANNPVSFTNAQALTIGTVATPYGATISGISAGTGDIAVNTTAGSLTVASGAPVSGASVGLEGADGLVLNANVNGTTSVGLRADTGTISQATSGSVITAPLLAVLANNGGVNLPGANWVGTLGGAAYGPGNDFLFRNATDLAIGSVSISAGAFSASGNGVSADDGTNKGAIDIRTTSGKLAVDNNAGVWGGSVWLQAAGDLEVGTQALAGGSSAAISGSGLLTLRGQSVRTSLPVGNTTGTSSTVSLAGGTGIQVTSTVGDVDFGSNTSLASTGTPAEIDVNAKGSVLGAGNFYSAGSPGPTTPGVKITAGGGISFGSISSTFYQGEGGGTGNAGRDVALKAGGDISGGGVAAVGDYQYSGGDGGNGGNVTMNAGGSINVDSVYVSGGYGYGGAGGGGGNVSMIAGGAVNASTVDASGGGSSEYTSTGTLPAGPAGQGGTVTLTAGGGITSQSIRVGGGSSWGSAYPAGAGGAAGQISLTTTAGDIALTNADANGGDGAPGGAGGHVTVTGGNVAFDEITAYGGVSSGPGTGGAGGTVDVNASGNVTMSPYWGDFAIVADGGSSNAGVGGAGGNISLKTGGSIVISLQATSCDCSHPNAGSSYASGPIYDALDSNASGLSASGGWGGTDGTGNGTAGGAGGSIQVQGTGSQLVLDGTLILAATGGDGGHSGGAGSPGGAGGAGGSVQAVSSGTVNLRSPYVFTDGGAGALNGDNTTYAADGTLGSFTASGTSVEVESDFAPSANWINASTVNLRGSSIVGATGAFQNSGTLSIYDSATISSVLANSGTLNVLGTEISLPALADNAGTVSVVAGSILDAPQFFTNTGTVQVDGTLRIGTVTAPTTTTTQIAAAVAPGTVFTNQASGVLSGSGTLAVDSGAGTVDNFGTLSPGGAGTVGTLTLNAGLVMEPGSVYAADILSTATHDTVLVSGSLVSGGSYVINYVGGPVFNAGDVLRMIQSAALDATTLPTSDKPELASAANGNDAVLVANVTLPTPVPPPPPDQQQALQQSNNQVTTFAQLFVQMSDQQQEQDKQDNRIGKDDIVVTDTACTR